MTATLNDEMIDHLASTVAKEIDFAVLTGLLCETGWTKIILSPMTSERSKSIDDWLATKCRGKHMTMGIVFVFEKPQDATWFTLKFGTPE